MNTPDNLKNDVQGESMENKQLAKKEQRSLSFLSKATSFTEVMEVCRALSKSNAIPTAYIGKPESLFVAMEFGAEVGLQPMQAIQNIMVVNNRPALWGDAIPALIYNAKVPVSKDGVQMGDAQLCELFDEDSSAKALNQGYGRCKVKRYGRPPLERTFSVDEAKRASLWNKAGAWSAYPGRMLQMRARGFACRDAFPDILKGLPLVEEVWTEGKYEPTQMPQALPPENAQIQPSRAETAETTPTTSDEKESNLPPKAVESQAGDAQEPGDSPADLISMDQRKEIFALLKKNKVAVDLLKVKLMNQWNIKGTADIPLGLLPEVTSWIKGKK